MTACARCNDTGWLDCSSYPESGCSQEGHGGPCTCLASARYLPPVERRAEDDEDRAELADLLGADMVGKLLEGDQG